MTDPLDELEVLYRRAYGRFLRVATAIVGDVDAARDVVQDAFASAIRQRHEYRGAGPLDAWVWRMVTRSAIDHVSRPRAAGEVADAPDDGVTSVDESLRRLVAALPERQRHVLFLRYYADLDYRAIAEVLDVSVGTVSASLHAAHASLRATLAEVRG
jgi:RNA polymerase sigma factor (sigma-70 family)